MNSPSPHSCFKKKQFPELFSIIRIYRNEKAPPPSPFTPLRRPEIAAKSVSQSELDPRRRGSVNRHRRRTAARSLVGRRDPTDQSTLRRVRGLIGWNTKLRVRRNVCASAAAPDDYTWRRRLQALLGGSSSSLRHGQGEARKAIVASAGIIAWTQAALRCVRSRLVIPASHPQTASPADC